jgi:hypothetical protein
MKFKRRKNWKQGRSILETRSRGGQIIWKGEARSGSRRMRWLWGEPRRAVASHGFTSLTPDRTATRPHFYGAGPVLP